MGLTQTKVKSFCTVKEAINKMKKLSTECQVIFAININVSSKCIQNIQWTGMTQCQKISKHIKEQAEDINTYFSTRHTDDQQAHEKMLNIINHQGNANQTHNEISPHTCQNGCYQKDNK